MGVASQDRPCGCDAVGEYLHAIQGLVGLGNEPRRGTPRQIGDDKIAETMTKTLETAMMACIDACNAEPKPF